MAKLRKWCAHRHLKMPYTRKSRYRKKAFIKSVPTARIVRFETGNLSKEFSYSIKLKSNVIGQIRHNALESARQSSNRVIEAAAGKTAYKLKVLTYPHHIVREHYQAAVAQADRMSSGMAHPFGKAMSLAVQVKRVGKAIMEIQCEKQHVDTAKLALKRAASKLPFTFTIEVKKNPKKVAAA